MGMHEALAVGIASGCYTKDVARTVIEEIRSGSKRKIDIGERF